MPRSECPGSRQGGSSARPCPWHIGRCKSAGHARPRPEDWWNQCQEQDSGSQVPLVTQRAISRKVHQLSPSKTRGSLSFHFECEYRVRQCQEIPTGRNTSESKKIKKGFSTMGNPRTVLERRECRQRMRARRSADKENSPTLTPTPEQIQDEALQWDRKNKSDSF